MFRYLLFPVLNALGSVLAAFAALMLVPALYSWVEGDGAVWDFLYSVGITLAAGTILFFTCLPFRRELTARHGFLLVTLSWTLTSAFATIPLLLNQPQYNFSELYFETVSCITTTGSTVITGLDSLPPSINGWRCFLSWVGGMGLIVFSVAILPLLGIGGAQLMKAETSGPMKETRLTPRVAETARALYIIYLGISAICVIAYHLAGMNWRDAVMHMMTTVSLSGIATHDASFAFFKSAEVETVAIFFMLICSLNFALHFVAWRRKSLLAYWRSTEARCCLAAFLMLAAGTAFALYYTGAYPEPLEAFRTAFFAVASTASTTGYASADWSNWPYGIPFILLLSSAVVSCAGSTGGGLKMLRVAIIFSQLRHEFTRLLYPNAVTPVTIDAAEIPNKIVFSVLSYAFIWLLSALTGVLLLLGSGMSPLESFSAAVASITNLGPGLGSVGPAGNYQALSDLQLNILSSLMLIGRLELFTVFVLFSRAFWKP